MNNISYLFFLLIISARGEASPALNQLEQEIQRTASNQIDLNVEKMQIEQQIESLKFQSQFSKNLLRQRTKQYFRLQKEKWGEFLFESDLSKQSRNIKILKNLNSYDFEAIKNYQKNLLILDQAKRNLENSYTELSSVRDRLKEMQNKLVVEENRYLTAKSQLGEPTFLKFKKNLTRPLNGLPFSKFGSVLDRNSQFFLINNGEIFRNVLSAEIRSIGPGKIIFRDLLPRWRETLIVEHDDNYYSVYAGVAKSDKIVGDVVSSQQIIGQASKEFYFELRHNNIPINPENWYSK